MVQEVITRLAWRQTESHCKTQRVQKELLMVAAPHNRIKNVLISLSEHDGNNNIAIDLSSQEDCTVIAKKYYFNIHINI